jgi:hypothetical protein
MAIQPAFSALDLCSSTPATTPSPNRIRIIVPMNSPIIGEAIVPSFEKAASGQRSAFS